jgi:hypothetical protein
MGTVSHGAALRAGKATLFGLRAGHEIWLYCSGRANAGEHAGARVQQREPAAGPLILMSDALSANRLEPTPPVEVVVCFCLAHGLRKFSDLEEAFPPPCAYVLGVLDQVFEHDPAARERRLSAQARLTYHQPHSGPLRDALHRWLEQPLEDREVERTVPRQSLNFGWVTDGADPILTGGRCTPG